MNLQHRLLPLSAVAIALSLSGCVFTNGPVGGRGDITFTWTLDGNACATLPDVTQVTIRIPGQRLQNDGVYGCINGGTAGITLLDFAPGTYNWEMEGRNNASTVLYFATGKVTVNGDVSVTVRMLPEANATGSTFITWTFPPSGISGGQSATCAQTVGPLSAVEVSIDGATTPAVFTCSQGQTSPGIRVDNLRAGSHTIEIWARGPDHAVSGRELYYYRTTSTLEIVAGGATAQQYGLGWAVGGLALRWNFAGTLGALTCAQAGVSTVYVNLKDSDGKFFPDTQGTGIPVPCLNNGVQGTTLPSSLLSYVYSGNYQVFLQARGTGNVLYRTSLTAPPTTSVTAGIFPLVDANTPVLQLSLQ